MSSSWSRKEAPMLSLPSMGGGAAGLMISRDSENTFIDDVFSTFLYTGTSDNKSIGNGIKFSNANAGNSVFFDGSNDYLSISSNSDFQLGTGDFTVEFFWNANSGNSGNYQQIVGTQSDGSTTSGIWRIGTRTTSNQIYFSSADGSGFDEPIWNVNVNDQAWYHIAITRASGYVYCYVNGVQQTNVGESNNITRSLTTSNALYIGRNARDATFIKGNVSNLRIVKGTAVYTSNFTTPTVALTNITNTTLLACQSSTSVTAATVSTGSISANGAPETSFGPFTGTGGKGGMVWIKDRSNSYNYVLQDTVRGAGATTKLGSNLTAGQNDGDNALQWSGYVSAFNNSGFSLDKTGSGAIDWANVNKSGDEYASWSFREQTGFFDIVTYTGNGSGSARTLDHNLGSIPGFIALKKYSSGSSSWVVYHRDLSTNGYLVLDSSTQEQTSANGSINSATSTQFTVGVDFNDNATNYVAYIFAGGESGADTARSVEFDGSGDYLSLASSSDLSSGTGDFTFEAWVKSNHGTSGSSQCIYDNRSGTGSNSTGFFLGRMSAHSGKVELYTDGNYRNTNGPSFYEGQWNHVAVVRQSNVIKLYLNGTESGDEYSVTNDYSNTTARIGTGVGGSDAWQGEISNVRFIKGTALYTSSFRPTYEPLTNITNTKLLCCNNSSTTGKTVGPTITANGNPTASSDSPFDDPAGFKFGDARDQNLIKCGSYIGNGSSTGPEINFGWEPQWILIKRSSASEGWYVIDSMRGIVSGEDDRYLTVSSTASDDNFDFGRLTSTGFKLETSNQLANADGSTYVYVAVRRPDGYVSKTPEFGTVGTDVFNTANYDSTAPAFNANFAVDFAMFRRTTSSYDWRTSARLIQTKYLKTNSVASETTENDYVFDYNDGWNQQTGYANTEVSWMWKRHAGFDVVAYTPIKSGSGYEPINHNLNKTPEMVWVKNRQDGGTNDQWAVYHKDLSGTPYNNALHLNETKNINNISNQQYYWGRAFTSQVFYVYNGQSRTGDQGKKYLAILFASVDGISKVGSYTGNNTDRPSINVGFQPRFIIIKRSDGNDDWNVYDSVRGMGSGNDSRLKLNSNASQDTPDHISLTSNGFDIESDNDAVNGNGDNYIYYAHA